ncbi:MAG: efflux RND transporter periplasmic adaptor subunit [Planctomycetota bacterium]
MTGAAFASLCLSGCERRQEAPPPPPVLEVAVVTIEPRPIVLTSELPGRTSGYRVAEIRPQVNGLIQKRLFTEGSDVQAGQALYQIDPAPFQAAHDSAKANLLAMQKAADRARAALAASQAGVARQQATLALAKTNRQRFADLFNDKAVSASERDQTATDVDVAEATLHAVEAQVDSDRAAVAVADAGIKQAEAAIQATQISLGYTKVNAPISGRIGRSSVSEGAAVTAYQALAMATIQQLDPIYVDVPQSTAQLARWRRSAKDGLLQSGGADQTSVRLVMEDGTPYSLAGTLGFREVTVDPTTGSVILRIVVPNPTGILLPGMFVRAIIEEGVSEQAILIPQQAVSRDPKGNPLVLIVDGEGKVRQRQIATDRALGDKWLISAGLAPGDRVVVEGMQKVRPGASVRTVPFDAGPKQPAESGRPVEPASRPS